MGGRIPQAFIDELLNRVDIIDIIDEHVPLRKAGRNYAALCPFHEEKTPSFTVSPDRQFYHCFGCGTHGTTISFLMDYHSMGFLDAIQALAARAGLELPREAFSSPASATETPLYEVLEKTARYYIAQLREHPASHHAIEYLKTRGVNEEIAAEFGLGFAPPGWQNVSQILGSELQSPGSLLAAGLVIEKNGRHYDRFRDRIMFPIRDQRGRVVGFGGRALGDAEPKYLNSPETPVFRKRRELYGLYQARKRDRDLNGLIVVEGYMDVLALSQSGICNAVATLGTATTNEHLERLFRVAPEIRFCFDGDSAGKRAAWRALETALPLLRQGRYVGFIFMPEGEDPDSLIRKLGASRFAAQARGVPLSEFLFDTLSSQVDTRTLDGRSRLVELAKPLINKIPTGAFRQLMVERLAELSGLSPDNLSLMVRTVQKSPKKYPRTKAVRSGQPPSLVRIAVTLLLREPSLAAQAEDSAKLHELDLPGIPLLLNVIQLIQQQPQIRCGAILERFRGSVDHSRLAKLLTHDLPIPDEAIAAEFAGVLRRLYRLWEKQQRERLMTIPRHELTDTQQQELHRLLAFGSTLS